MENKKENKRKNSIGIIALMLVLLIAVGSIAGITLAKYVNSATIPSQTATIAMWGYTLTANADASLFGTNYGSVSDNFATKVNNGGVVVSSSSGANVLAPGTKGEATILTIDGSGEVDAILTITVSNDFKTIHLTGGDTNYYPIKWKVNDKEITVANNAVDANAFADAIADALNVQGVLPSNVTAVATNNVVTVELPANYSAKIDNFKLKISWEWALQTSKQAPDTGYYDVEDTILGQIAHAKGTAGNLSAYAGSTWEIALGLSANVEQVQQFSNNNP